MLAVQPGWILEFVNSIILWVFEISDTWTKISSDNGTGGSVSSPYWNLKEYFYCSTYFFFSDSEKLHFSYLEGIFQNCPSNNIFASADSSHCPSRKFVRYSVWDSTWTCPSSSSMFGTSLIEDGVFFTLLQKDASVFLSLFLTFMP